MAKFKVTGPDGKNYAIEAPDADTAAREADAFFGVNQSIGDKALDVAASAGSGVTKSVLDAAALPAEAAHLARVGADKLGIDTQPIRDVVNSLPGLNPLKLSRKAKALAQGDNFVGNYANYKPETTTGKYAKTIGEFSAGALGPKAGALTRAGKYVLAPALASEGLGQATEGTVYEPYARAAGGLLGLGGGALALNPLGEKGFRSVLATADDVKKQGSAAYKAAADANVSIRTSTIDRMKSELAQHLDDIGFLPGNQTKASNVLNEVWKNLDGHSSRVLAGRGNQTGFGQRPLSIPELDAVGSRIAKQIKGLNPTDSGDRRVLWAAKHFVDDFVQKLGNADIIAGDLGKGKAALQAAKKYWTKKSKLELLDQMEERAGETGKARYTRGGMEHATRSEFLKFLRKDPNKRQRLTDKQLKAFERVSKGTAVGNFARDTGKQIAGFGGLGGAGTGIWAGGLLGGAPGAILGAGLSAGSNQLLKMLARRSTARAAGDARALIANDDLLPKRGYMSNIGRLLTANQIFNGSP